MKGIHEEVRMTKNDENEDGLKTLKRDQAVCCAWCKSYLTTKLPF